MKVLFLGNSHTFYNDMPQIFADICKERGKDVEVAMQAHPGVTYGWHYQQLTELRFALLHGGFDYMVMQQAAHSPWRMRAGSAPWPASAASFPSRPCPGPRSGTRTTRRGCMTFSTP